MSDQPAAPVIEDHKKLARQIAKFFGKGCNARHCEPRPRQARHNKMAYEFVDGNKPQLPIGDRLVCEIHSGAVSTYWISLLVDLEREPLGDVITHASIALFSGSSPQTAIRVFRAEWDPRATSNMHAQPHWNIEARMTPADGHERFQPDRLAAGAWKPPTPHVPDAPPTKSSRDWLGGFHFAMGSSWQTGGGWSAGVLSEEYLLRWVQGCVQYIRAQLALIDP